MVHGLHARRWAPRGRKVCATDHRTVRASRRFRRSRRHEGRVALEPRCRHPASAESMAHGRNREPCRRHRGLRPLETTERPDPTRSAMAAPTADVGTEAANEGATGSLRARRMEAVRYGHGTRLPTRTGTAKPSKAVGSCTAPSRWFFIVFNPRRQPSRTAARERTEPVGGPNHFLIGRNRFSAPPASSRTISAADKTSFTPSTDSPAKNDIASIVP